MTHPAWQPTYSSSERAYYQHQDASAAWEAAPADIVGVARVRRSRLKRFLRGLVVLAILAGGGWALVEHRHVWQGWLTSELSGWRFSLPRGGPAAGEQATPATDRPTRPDPAEQALRQAAVEPSPRPAQPLAAGTPGSVAGTQTSPLATASLPPAAPEYTEPAEPTERPAPTDPLQKRAVAVGLHPDISRALLARLSATDFRNAGIAIERAVAETPDTGQLVWPPQRKPDEALFKVHFVAGAAPDCRRYVVTVAKDGWLTTALPMERCGRSRVARKQ